MMAGQIAAFPSLYASKVGKTTDAAYKLCYAAYMSSARPHISLL